MNGTEDAINKVRESEREHIPRDRERNGEEVGNNGDREGRGKERRNGRGESFETGLYMDNGFSNFKRKSPN